MNDPLRNSYISAIPDLQNNLRYRFHHKGWEALSDAEVLCFALGGTEKTFLIARRILEVAGNSLPDLARLSLPELQSIDGVGETRALIVSAIMEFARRRTEADTEQKPGIRDAKDIYTLMKADLMDRLTEEFWVVLLNRANVVIKKVFISSGGVSGTVADPKVIFRAALESLAAGIILVHNHPSGSTTPSQADIQLTRKLQNAGRMLDIPVVDHVIFGNSGYLSMSDEGLM
ncbi:MAG: DNA repair protein RadC [Bacteroidota bacterium]